jgi:hypothetical protein
MQYACTLDRQGLASLADKLAGALGAESDAGAFEWLHDTAYFCVQTHFMTASGRDAIAAAFDRYQQQAAPGGLGDRHTIIDAKNGRVAISCAMRPRQGEAQNNTIFFRVRENRIQELYLYSSGDNLFA